jgi:hypothetical protein
MHCSRVDAGFLVFATLLLYLSIGDLEASSVKLVLGVLERRRCEFEADAPLAGLPLKAVRERLGLLQRLLALCLAAANLEAASLIPFASSRSAGSGTEASRSV